MLPSGPRPTCPKPAWKVARFLEVGLFIDSRSFRGFAEAFDPADITWNHDSAPFMQRALEIEKGALDMGICGRMVKHLLS